MSASISVGCSSPTERRIIPSVIPTAKRSVSESLLCVVEAGCVMMVLESPRLEDKEHIWIALIKERPASKPPLSSKDIIFPPWVICFRASAY